MRIFIDIAYKGTQYHGWQRQKNALSVQQVLEEALSKILGQTTEVTGSGRTDTGVHASTQVVHLDVDDALDLGKLAHRLNAILPNDIAIKSIRKVISDAHARFHAVSRSYEYHIIQQKNAFKHGLVYVYRRQPDLEKMNIAAQRMLNYTDFECFSKVKTDVHTFNCQITDAVWKQQNENLVFHVSANRFLRGMVRAIVGTLLLVGEEKMSVDEFEEVLKSRDRNKSGRSVPPEGLFLTRVEYPSDIYQD